MAAAAVTSSNRAWALFEPVVSYGEDMQAVIRRLGTPNRRTKVPTDDPEISPPDTMIFLEYSGLTVGVYQVTRDRRHLLSHVELSGRNCVIGHGLRIGSPSQDVINVLGEPQRYEAGRDTTIFIYPAAADGSGPENYLQFYVTNRAVWLIRWMFYFG